MIRARVRRTVDSRRKVVNKVLYMRYRGAGTHGDFTASQIELVHSTHGLSRAGRFRLRLGVFVQSGSLNSVVEVTHAEGGAIGKLLVSFLFCWIYDGSAWAACTQPCLHNAFPLKIRACVHNYSLETGLWARGIIFAVRSGFSHDLGSWLWCLLCASQALASLAHLGLSVSNVSDTSISLAAALRHVLELFFAAAQSLSYISRSARDSISP